MTHSIMRERSRAPSRLAVTACALLAVAVPGRARGASVDEAARSAAKEITAALATAGIGPDDMVGVEPFENDTGDHFNNALVVAIAQAGGPRITDKKALQKAVEEATLDLTGESFAEIAGAMGCKALVLGKVVPKADALSANIRVVAVGLGTVLASTTVTWTTGGTEMSAEAHTLDMQLRRLADRIAASLHKLDGEARYQRFGVLPFEEIGSTTKEKELGLLVASELTTLLHRDHGLVMVERSQLTRVLDELALAQSGVIDASQVAEVGKLAGAQGLVLGSVAEAGDRYKVTTRISSATTGEIIAADSTELPAGDLVALSSEAVVLRTRTGALYRSILLPGWGQLYNRQPIKAGAFVAGEVLSIGAAVLFHLRGTAKEDEYRKLTNPGADFAELIDAAGQNFRYRNIFIYVAIAVHVANIVDAVLSGKSFDSADVGGSSGALGFEW